MASYTQVIEAFRQSIGQQCRGWIASPDQKTGLQMTTLADVAKHAGVSLSTASYALSGKRPISEQTRSRVLAATEELGFHPNNLGRALASGKTRTIALLYPAQNAVLSPMPMEFVTAAAAQSELRGYALILSTTNSTRENILSLIRRGFVDGYLVMEVSLADPRIELLSSANVPFALIGRPRELSGLHLVDLDFEHAIAIAVDHLYQLGHRAIAVLCRTDGPLKDYGPTFRMRRSFEEQQRKLGINGVFRTCEANPAAGETAVDRILHEHPDITAIISSNTESIPGVFRAATERGIAVPADLSILGIVSPRIAEFLSPSVTTVDFPAEEMGRRGVDFLIDQLEGRVETPQQLVLRSSVTIRSSTGPVRH
jgi:DNA-binding LacI/PurR family transcriptional regulator